VQHQQKNNGMAISTVEMGPKSEKGYNRMIDDRGSSCSLTHLKVGGPRWTDQLSR
jgi:hypothetical protein